MKPLFSELTVAKIRNRMKLVNFLGSAFAYSGVALAIVFSSGANAGTSGEDPVVSQIRSQFMAAAVPYETDLQIGALWQCREFNALSGDFRRGDQFHLMFQSYSGNLVELQVLGGNSDILALTENSLSGNLKSSGQRIYFRIAANGDLMGELLLRADQPQAGEMSVSEPYSTVFTYVVCPNPNPAQVPAPPPAQSAPVPQQPTNPAPTPVPGPQCPVTPQHLGR